MPFGTSTAASTGTGSGLMGKRSTYTSSTATSGPTQTRRPGTTCSTCPTADVEPPRSMGHTIRTWEPCRPDGQRSWLVSLPSRCDAISDAASYQQAWLPPTAHWPSCATSGHRPNHPSTHSPLVNADATFVATCETACSPRPVPCLAVLQLTIRLAGRRPRACAKTAPLLRTREVVKL